MENSKELEVAKSYKGKAFIPEKLRKIAIGSGNTSALVYNRRITKSQGTLIGITDEIFNKWWDDGIYFTVYIDLKEPDNVIDDCSIRMSKEGYRDDGSLYFTDIEPTQQDLEIFQNVMDYITNSNERF